MSGDFKLDKELKKIILQALEEGSGRVRAVKTAGISYTTFMKWLRKDKRFLKKIIDAELNGNDKIKDLAQRGVIEKFNENWQAAAWWLERKYPEEFALKQRLEHTIKVPKIVAENEEHKELLEKIKNDEIHESVSRKLKGLSESGKTNH